ncbi:MAG: MinD/ParA family protein [Microbacterium sp.]
MTPDRPDLTPQEEEAEHGVLSDTGSLDTTRLGILGGATEQVSVSMHADSDDDFADDVIDDDVAFDRAFPVSTATAEGEIIDGDAAFEDWTVEGAAPVGGVEDVTEAEEVVEDMGDVTDAETPGADTASASEASADTAAASASAATRWETQQPDDRAHAIERVQPRADVTLTSKRLGEFEPDRESADLLTADRLLDPHQVVRSEPEGAWQHFLYSISGHRINLGDGKRARARKDLDRRIAAPLNGGARFVAVLSRKGGVGKTTITTLLGMALADARDDRIIAVDANPDRGTLAERISRHSGNTVRDLVRDRGEVVGYNDLSTIVARDETRLDVLASDSDPRVSEAFSDRDYQDVASIAAHYYSIVLTDTGTGIVHSVMGATLELSDQLVIVSGLSVDEARLASETLTWLETNGYSDQVRSAVVVLNNARPGTPMVRLDELEAHFRTRVRSVVRVPYDPHIAAGSAITFRDLLPATRLAARQLAATVVEGLRSLASAA